MGTAAPGTSQGNDAGGAGVRFTKVLAQNSGVCMESGSGVLLNLGAGKIRWPGWTTVGFGADVDTDLRKLPLPDDYADGAVAIHVIEHFYQWEALPLLKEWRRVLKPGASLSLECPCMDRVYDYIVKLVQAGHKNKSEFMTKWAFWGDPKHKDPLMTHKWGYFQDDLAAVMREAGFRDVRVDEPRYHFAMRDMRVTGVK